MPVLAYRITNITHHHKAIVGEITIYHLNPNGVDTPNALIAIIELNPYTTLPERASSFAAHDFDKEIWPLIGEIQVGTTTKGTITTEEIQAQKGFLIQRPQTKVFLTSPQIQ